MADISYTRTTWADGSEGGTAIDATKLNNIEQGVVDAVAAIGPNDTTADGTLKAQIDSVRESVYPLNEMRFGTKSCTPVANGVAVIDVEFSPAMTSAPRIVLLTLQSGANNEITYWRYSAQSLTSTGFKISLYNGSASINSRNIGYIAVR